MRIREKDPKDLEVFKYRNKELGQTWFLEIFDLCEAGWTHNGDHKKPHAEFTPGMCSNGYFDCRKVLKYTNLCDILAHQLVKKLRREAGITKNNIDWVVGSPYSAITFSYEVAKLLEAVHGFPEKDPNNPKKFIWRDFIIPEGAKVLQIEELITTSNTFYEVRRAINQANPYPVDFLPIVGSLVHGPPRLPVNYSETIVISLIEKKIWAVEPSECPLCKAGSKRLKPKSNWAELTGKA